MNVNIFPPSLRNVLHNILPVAVLSNISDQEETSHVISSKIISTVNHDDDRSEPSKHDKEHKSHIKEHKSPVKEHKRSALRDSMKLVTQDQDDDDTEDTNAASNDDIRGLFDPPDEIPGLAILRKDIKKYAKKSHNIDKKHTDKNNRDKKHKQKTYKKSAYDF